MQSPSPPVRAAHPVVQELSRDGLVAVIRAGHELDVRALAETLLAARVRFIEITLTTPGALDALLNLQPFRRDGLRVGAGTVLTEADARAAADIGADYLVSPTLEPAVVLVAHGAGAPAFMGGLTPNEILAAWRAGSDVVKVFPGRVATPGYFADIAGPLPGIPLMPTGGVDEETAPAYIRAGAVAVGVGKSLVDPGLLRAGDYSAVAASVTRWRDLVDQAIAARR